MAGPTEKTGSIAATETWALEDSPFLITGNITLSTDKDVYVEAGVEIEVQARDCTITMGSNSEFILGGTKEAPIYMHGQVSIKDFWTGFVMASGARVWAKHTTFEDASKLIDGGNINDSVYFQNCIARRCHAVISQATNALQLALRECLFEHNEYVLTGELEFAQDTNVIQVHFAEHIVENIIRDNEYAIYPGGTAVGLHGRRNEFYRNKYAIYLAGGSVGSCTFEDCWWGSDSGPEESAGNPTGTGDLVDVGGAGVDYDPWMTKGRYVPIPDDVREFANRILREGTPSGEETATSYLEDDILDRIIDRAEKRVDRWLSAGPPLENRLLGYGTETDEMHDLPLDGIYLETRYRPIVSVTSVDARSGTSGWSSVPNQESGGWYASEEDLRRGRIHIDYNHSYEKDSFRVTYDHGYYDAPEEVREAVIKLATLDVFHVILQAGEDDPYAPRAKALKLEIDALRNSLMEQKKRYVVI